LSDWVSKLTDILGPGEDETLVQAAERMAGNLASIVSLHESTAQQLQRAREDLAEIRGSSIVRAAMQSREENANTLRELRHDIWGALGMQRYNGRGDDGALATAVRHQRDDMRMFRLANEALRERMAGKVEAVEQAWALLHAVAGTQSEGWAVTVDDWARVYAPDHLQWTIEPGEGPGKIVCQHRKIKPWRYELSLVIPTEDDEDVEPGDIWLHQLIMMDWASSGAPALSALVGEESLSDVATPYEIENLLFNYGHGRLVIGMVRVSTKPITADDIVTAGDMLVREVNGVR